MSKKVEETKNTMLKQYLSLQLLYVEFTDYIENKIKNILIENGIKYQSMNSRVKTYDSLEKKLTEKLINGICKNIKNLNDLSGVRIIFYDEDELKRFSNILYNEFNIETYKISEDIMEYDGTNVTISLKKDVNKFNGLLCEIQLTTVLSHAMNEFGHNIIYKDIDELKSKDIIEYERIKSIFSETRRDILKIMANLEFINHRVQSIKSGSKNIELLLGEDFKNKLQNVNSLIDLEDVINKMIEVIPIVNHSEDKYKTLYDSGIICSIVKRFSELPIETAKFLNYDTYEYKFGKLLEFLQCYKYLWLNDFKTIIAILYIISSNNNLLGKFDDFIKDLIVSDKADSVRGYGGYHIHEKIYTLILDNELDEYIRIKFAEYFCDLNYNYCEESGMNQISFVRNQINPNENYINKIYTVIDVLLSLFINKYSKNKLQALININCELERNAEVFDLNPIYEFFDKNYDDIDMYSKNELYKSVCFWKNTKIKSSNFYKKLKQDKVQNLFAMLFNYYIEEIPGSKYAEREEFKNNYLNDYVSNFKKSNVKDIVKILNVIDDENISDLNIWYAGNFLIKVGELKGYGKKILDEKWNEYILLGIMKTDDEYELIIKDFVKAQKIVQAMHQTGYINLKILDLLIDYSDKSKNKDLEISIMKLILNNAGLVCVEKYKKYYLKKLNQYNSDKKGIISGLLYNPQSESKIIEEYDHSDICILMENLRYSNFNNINSLFLYDLFEKYPNDIRELLRKKINDNSNSNLYNSYRHINLTECKNYNIERYKNLSFCFEMLRENEWYKISNYIHYLIGEYSKELEMNILKYLKENDNYDSYSIAIDLCRIFNASISCWNIYEYIVSKVELNDKLLNEIECLLFNTGVVTGEYGLANSFKEKYEFFKNLKPRNQKVKDFVKKEISRFKNLYQDEKNKTDKELITKETKYKLENKKTDEN